MHFPFCTCKFNFSKKTVFEAGWKQLMYWILQPFLSWNEFSGWHYQVFEFKKNFMFVWGRGGGAVAVDHVLFNQFC